MRPRFSAKVLCLLLLAAGLGVGREGENDTSDDGSGRRRSPIALSSATPVLISIGFGGT